MRILANPALLRAMIVLVCGAGAFILGLVCIRMLRQQISEESDLDEKASPSLDALPMHVYNTVIQQLKQQKQELSMQLQAEQERARVSEALSQAVWLNISSGVLIFGSNGLVKTFNPAAKLILGFASMNGMSAEDVFRGALVRNPESNGPVSLAEEINAVLRKVSLRRECEAEYETPAGEMRLLALSILPVTGSGTGNALGTACLIENLSRQQKPLRESLEEELKAGAEAPAAEVAAGQ